MKGQLPKAYLRIDPNLDQTHPDPGLFVKLLCAGARQPRRGLFKDRAVFDRCLGKKAAERLLERGDVDVRQEDGAVVIDGWDIWQEGDLTVGERMRRYRNKERVFTVTPPLPGSNSPSEAVRQQGSKAVGTDNGTDSAPVVAAPKKPASRTWLTPYVEAWRQACGGEPVMGKLAKSLRPLDETHGPGETLSRWVRYLAETPAEYASAAKFSETFGRWAVGSPGTALVVARGSQPLSPRAETRRASHVAAIAGGILGDGTLPGGNES